MEESPSLMIVSNYVEVKRDMNNDMTFGVEAKIRGTINGHENEERMFERRRGRRLVETAHMKRL